MRYRILVVLLPVVFLLASCEMKELVTEVSAGEMAVEEIPAGEEGGDFTNGENIAEGMTAEGIPGDSAPNEIPAGEIPVEEISAEAPAFDGFFSGVQNFTEESLSSEEPSEKNISGEITAPVPSPEPIDYEAIRPNEAGEIPIIMYHGIDKTNPGRYDRKTSDFINDLQGLYDRGFRLVSLSDALSGNINLPAGLSPAVLTFDDAKASAFSLEEKDGSFVTKEGSALEVIERFNEDHPGFGAAAAIFIIGCDEPFRGSAGTVEQRLAYLTEHGYEIGNHTYSHQNLSKQSAARLQEEIGLTNELLLSISPSLILNAVAYPGGVNPKESLQNYILHGEYNGAEYNYLWGIRCAPGLTSANPFHVNFDPLNVPRLRPTDDSTSEYAVTDLWYYLRKYESEPWVKYTSDGDPKTVAVHKDWEKYVNTGALGERELVVWGE